MIFKCRLGKEASFLPWLGKKGDERLQQHSFRGKKMSCMRVEFGDLDKYSKV